MPQVLIVDDSRLAARVIERFLKEKEISIMHVATVAELFGLRGHSSRLREFLPELFLLDIYMPEMDGLDVLRKLKARKDVADVPVVMLSSTTDASTIEQAMNLGAEGFIQKPVIPEKMLTELKRVCSPDRTPILARRLSGDLGSTRKTDQNNPDLVSGIADLNYMYDILEGDMAAVRQLVISFLEAAPEQIEAIRKAVTEDDAEKLMRSAHRFKGGVGNFGAPMITDTAFELEKIGRAGDLEKARVVFESLEQDAGSMMDELWAWMSKNPTSEEGG